MAGVNSLGIGSSVLTADLLDQLREADNKTILKPLETKLELSNQKDEAYTLLSSLMTTFKSSTSSLGNENLYLGRSVDGSNDDVTVTAKSGADVQSFNITNINKAEKDVWNSSNSFSSTENTIPGLGAGTLTIDIGGGETLDIEYTALTTLDDIKTAINDGIGEKMTASNLQIGESDYSFAISADELNEAITFSDSNPAVKQLNTVTLSGNVAATDTFTWSDGVNSITLDETLTGDLALVAGETPTQSGIRIADAINADPTLSALYTAVAVADGFTIESKTAGLDFTGTSTGTQASTEIITTAADDSLMSKLGLENIQEAKAATFDYNGISVTRSTNDISDLINGVTITLNQNQDANASANIKINQNDTSISTEMSLMVENFNLLSSNLKDMTNYDAETSNQGIFFGDNFVKSISRSITNMLTTVNSSGNSLIDYGIEIDKEGVMSLDSTIFSEKFAEDPTAMQLLFIGNADTEGVLSELDDKMHEYTGSDKLLSNFSTQLSDAKENLIAQYDKQKAALDARYETMTKKFAAYDSIISKLNNSFSSLQMMIDSEADK